MTSGAASLPAPGAGADGTGLPDLDRLRVALRPAELPLPHPVGVLDAAHRVGDLVHAERYRDARALAEEFRSLTAPPAERLALLRAALHGAVLSGQDEQVERDAADLVSLLRRSGFAEQAAAVVAVVLERGPFERDITATARTAQTAQAAQRARAAGGGAPAPRGRRRGEAPQASPEMLVVVRALERTALPGPRGAPVDPRRDAARLRAALGALPTVRDRLLTDPERELRLRLAQALEGAGETSAATTAALDVLELIEHQEATEHGALGDPARLATAAHAVLARTLCIEHPPVAVHHALAALEAMPEIEDPPLRIGLITALLQGLMAAGATSHASFAAGRLASLQRTLGREALRIAPLLAVAAQRVQAERYDAAWVPLDKARTIAREQRDRRALLEVARLAASIHERTGDGAASLRELRSLADHARWLADDLATPVSAQGELIRIELEANALALRRALDLGRTESVLVAARAVERRTRPDGGRPLLPPELLWDHRVDARVGLFIAVGSALARGGWDPRTTRGQHTGQAQHAGQALHAGQAVQTTAGVGEEIYERRRREALEAIGEMPPGHDDRARYWATYLEDRHAHLLAEQGRTERARRAARRARSGWVRLGRDEDVARLDALQESVVRDQQGQDLAEQDSGGSDPQGPDPQGPDPQGATAEDEE
ncbi:hypothetical protein [Brachybacterium sp.]|uniref:hypothetical protein n=1 Tax=Brachybacterium sp. TaxID=1891286 RepID=UPI002ED277A3